MQYANEDEKHTVVTTMGRRAAHEEVSIVSANNSPR